MANCLMQINQCGFPNCAQHFANQYDLTAHIEYTHIPVIEEDVKRKNQLAASLAIGDQPAQQPTMNLPLSYYSRVFRTAYRPNSIKPEPLKVSFNHYKKRSLRERQVHPNQLASKILRDMMTRQGRHMTLEDAEKRLMDVDFEECGPENNEVRYRCHIVDCNKRYKSMFALRVHMKIVHNVVVSEDAKSLTNYPSEDVKPNLAALQQSMQQQLHMNPPPPDSTVSSGTPTSVPSNAPNTPLAQGSPLPGATPNFGNPATNSTSYKCSYCSKRYKTSSGLSNHMMASHQKISDVQDAPSPQVVEQLISQVRMQRQQQEQNNTEQGQQRSIPPQTTQSQLLASILKSSSHTRTFSVTTTQQPIRFSQQHYQVNLDNQPSTGQVLQMQMQHQKRMKQIKEQQAAQEAAAAAASVQPQQYQQGLPMHQPQFSSPSISQMSQNAMQSSSQQQLGQMPQQQQQQFHQMPPQQQHSPYPQQMHHQMVQHSPHHYQQYQQHQQSPQFPPYQQPSPQQQQSNGPPPQRSPVPLSQSLPPLNSMTQQQRASMQQMPPPNAVSIQFSPPNSQGFNMMSSPPNGQQMSSQPPPYNH